MYTRDMRNKIIIIGVAVLAIVIGVLIFLSGTGSGAKLDSGTAYELNKPVAAVAVPFTKLAVGAKSSVAVRANYLITSPSELSKLWTMIDAKGNPPTVDFSKQTVLAVFAGKESTSSIAIAKIEDTNTRLVSISITRPEGACAAKVPATSPYEIAVVPASSLPLTHTDILTTTKCQN
jgi:hypothetical protein